MSDALSKWSLEYQAPVYASLKSYTDLVWSYD